MKKYLVMLCAVFATSYAFAAGDANQGKQKAEKGVGGQANCVSCHGPDGNSALPTFPRLAGQNEDYLVHAMRSYKNGKRKNPIMQPIAAVMSAQDMEDLAAYFAQQKGLVVKK